MIIKGFIRPLLIRLIEKWRFWFDQPVVVGQYAGWTNLIVMGANFKGLLCGRMQIMTLSNIDGPWGGELFIPKWRIRLSFPSNPQRMLRGIYSVERCMDREKFMRYHFNLSRGLRRTCCHVLANYLYTIGVPPAYARNNPTLMVLFLCWVLNG